MQIKRIRSIRSLMKKLTKLATPANHSDFVFRGHSNSSWKIQSTFGRYSTSPLFEYRDLALQQVIRRFQHSMARLGDRQMEIMSLREKMEFARHAGVPSPLIDFTHSPLIALWFAFNGIRGSVQKSSSVALYSLNLMHLTGAYAYFCKESGMEGSLHSQFKSMPVDFFRWERKNFFEHEYPLDVMKFLQLSAS